MGIPEKLPRFEWSTALLDEHGRLLEWDSGFLVEFEICRDLVAPGVRFQDILRAAYEKAFGTRFLITDGARILVDAERHLAERLSQFGRPTSFEYVTRHQQPVRVNEYPTPSGGIFRVAQGLSFEHTYQYALSAGGDHQIAPTEVPMWFRRDHAGQFTFAPTSDALRRFLELPPDFGAVDPLSIYSLIEETPEERARASAAYRDSFRDLSPYFLNLRVRCPSGKLKLVRATFAPSANEDGSVLWSGLLRDVTSEVHAENELELLKSAVVHSGDGIMIFEMIPASSIDGQPHAFILYINRAFEQLCGYTADKIIGKSTDEFRLYYECSDLGARIMAALKAGDTSSFEFEMFGAQGEPFWVEGRVVILQRDTDGKFRWALVIRDIEERRRAHAELLDAKNKAEAANLAKSQFLANMSHELRTPLNAIIGFSEVMKEELIGPSGNARYREYAKDIHNSGRHLLAIIDDVLEMSKVEADRLELRATEVEFLTVAEAALKLVRQQAHEFGVKLSCDVPESLPKLFADTLRLKQVLLNLLSNAIKFCTPGGWVAIGACVNPDGSFSAWVEDTGIGMTPDEVVIALQPFRQVANELTRNRGGTGLGLPLASRLMALHDGRLELCSAPRAGTTATITLPAARVLHHQRAEPAVTN